MRSVSCRGSPLASSQCAGSSGGLWPCLVHQVLGLLVWALIADTPYHLYPAYGWVMFVAVFLWLVTIVFFILYLFQLHMKLYMVPWPLVVSLGGVRGGCVQADSSASGSSCHSVTFQTREVAGGVGPQPACRATWGREDTDMGLAFSREECRSEGLLESPLHLES